MTYEWICTKEGCGLTVEKMMKLAAYEKTKNSFTCLECHSPMVPKISGGYFRLVGGGWARDDYSNYVRNEQKREMDSYDKHTIDHERLMQKEQRLGEV